MQPKVVYFYPLYCVSRRGAWSKWILVHFSTEPFYIAMARNMLIIVMKTTEVHIIAFQPYYIIIKQLLSL